MASSAIWGALPYHLRNLQVPPHPRVESETRNEFLRNYRYQKFLSHATILTATTCALKAVHLLATGPVSLVALALSVSALVLAKFWHMRPNDPTRLAEAVWNTMHAGDEKKALELLKKGANLDLGVQGLQFKPAARNLFEYACERGHHEIIEYLTGIGFNRTRAYQVAQTLETVQFLSDCYGVIRSNANEEGLSPLGAHLGKLESLLEESRIEKREPDRNAVLEECRIIEWLVVEFGRHELKEDDFNPLLDKVLDFDLQYGPKLEKLITDGFVGLIFQSEKNEKEVAELLKTNPSPREIILMACDAMSERKQRKALLLLRAAGFNGHFQVPMEGRPSLSLFEYASELGLLGILRYIAKETDFHLLQYTRALHFAQKAETVRFLLDSCEIAPNDPRQKGHSPLGVHLLKVERFFSEEGKELQALEECRIVELLYKKGARLQTQDYVLFPEGKRSFYNQLLEKIQKFDIDGVRAQCRPPNL